MTSVYLREQKRYTQEELTRLLQCPEERCVRILKRLKEYGVLKAVKVSDDQSNLLDLSDEDIEIADVEIGENEYLYVVTFVGVITIDGRVLKCYPKYQPDEVDIKDKLKQVLQVLWKYNAREQIVRMYNESNESSAFNMLAVMLFLLRDYFEHGVYLNTQDIIESNGAGDILWDKTINDTFTLLSRNRPYYPDLQTRKRVNDDFDYFKRLHECILTRCTEELQDADLLDLFDMSGVILTDETLDDFGDKEYILDQLIKELNIQFNTRKQMLLKTMYAFIANSNALDDLDCFSMFGTNSFNLVWERVCADVLDNQLERPIGGIKLPRPLASQYVAQRTTKLKDLIDRPMWTGYRKDGSTFSHTADATLIPDIVAISSDGEYHKFIIFDAKYYTLQLEPTRKLRGNPGIESVTKQYLYQLAYMDFITVHGFNVIHNCFLLPTSGDRIVNKGYTSLAMLHHLQLKDIQIRLLPAEKMYSLYLENKKLSIEDLELDSPSIRG